MKEKRASPSWVSAPRFAVGARLCLVFLPFLCEIRKRRRICLYSVNICEYLVENLGVRSACSPLRLGGAAFVLSPCPSEETFRQQVFVEG